jgi:hypothetical protein
MESAGANCTAEGMISHLQQETFNKDEGNDCPLEGSEGGANNRMFSDHTIYGISNEVERVRALLYNPESWAPPVEVYNYLIEFWTMPCKLMDSRILDGHAVNTFKLCLMVIYEENDECTIHLQIPSHDLMPPKVLRR